MSPFIPISTMPSVTYSPVVVDTTCNVVYLNNLNTGSGYTGPATVNITSSGNGGSLSADTALINGEITESFTMATDGVVKVIINYNTSSVYTAMTVSTCSVDCCIAKLVEDAIKCTCKCDKCKEELDRAEKVFLLLQAAEYSASQGNEQLATEQYDKAKDMCIEVCACGC